MGGGRKRIDKEIETAIRVIDLGGGERESTKREMAIRVRDFTEGDRENDFKERERERERDSGIRKNQERCGSGLGDGYNGLQIVDFFFNFKPTSL